MSEAELMFLFGVFIALPGGIAIGYLFGRRHRSQRSNHMPFPLSRFQTAVIGTSRLMTSSGDGQLTKPQ